MSQEPSTGAPDAQGPAAAASSAPEIERTSYDLLRERLLVQGQELKARAEALNAKRLALFGSSALEVLGSERIRSENNCSPRDLRAVGPYLLFGYNVFIGLRSETRVADVFSLFRFTDQDATFTFAPVAADDPANFLRDPTFERDFKELYKYYKDTRLLQLRRTEGRLLAIFQTGPAAIDLKVFRFSVDSQDNVRYLDNRGEREHVFPPSHDFTWTPTSRDQFVFGRHPHVNILDEVFVETVSGDLTIKVENNTEDGLGIYREPVDEPHQSLDDAQIAFAKLGRLIVLKVLPYKETVWRYLVFNTRTRTVERIDAIGQACQQLPEDQGLIFPGGFYLQSGDSKTFDGDTSGMEFKRALRSPNGEDVLYMFYESAAGRYILLSYNLIRKEVQNPIHCHGYALFPDGKMVVFRAASDEPTRVHPMQVWQTPYASPEHLARTPSRGTFLEKVGNADLVRGIADAFGICRLVAEQVPSSAVYEDLIKAAVRVADAYFWLDHPEAGLKASVLEIKAAADLIVGEFEKVQTLKRQAQRELAAAEGKLAGLIRGLDPENWTALDRFISALADLRKQRGHLISLKDLRYADLPKIAALETQVTAAATRVGAKTVDFLLQNQALAPWREAIEAQLLRVDETGKTADLQPIAAHLEEVGTHCELLRETVGHLAIEDPTVRTRILEGIAEVLAQLNRGRALLLTRQRALLEQEGSAEFAVRFKLLKQNLSGALNLATSPEKCDEQLAKLLLEVEELEDRYGELEQFLAPLATLREEIYEALSSQKQALTEARERRAQSLMAAAERILSGVVRRAGMVKDHDALNTYFATDPMVAKVADLVQELRQLHDNVRADELEARIKAARQEATRLLRDRLDLFAGGTETIQLGQHRFSVNTRPFELTLVPRVQQDPASGREETRLVFHLTGTDFYETVDDPAMLAARDFWEQSLVSETATVYRSEYLAYCLYQAASSEPPPWTLSDLRLAAAEDGKLVEQVRQHAAERFDEGYERGVHDHDAGLILRHLLALEQGAGLLRFTPRVRALASLFWAFPLPGADPRNRARWERQAQSLGRLMQSFGVSSASAALAQELAAAIGHWASENQLLLPETSDPQGDALRAGAYLAAELAQTPPRFATSAQAVQLVHALRQDLAASGQDLSLSDDLRELADAPGQAFALATAWVRALLARGLDRGSLAPFTDEAAALLVTAGRLERTTVEVPLSAEVAGLLGQHPRLIQRSLALQLDEFLARLAHFSRDRVPAFRRWQELRQKLLAQKRAELRLNEYQPKVMSAFVRNQLIDQVYLPLLGNHLAKQLGALGESRRTDQMGLLLLISPPGYGKTTLMEYLASRLGMVFVKVNGPALGHGVTSLDPAEAPNATARQEVERINFALELGNNVLLYLDDIQHTHAELLQKFISLADAQRRIEGVWRGRTRTYDLRGKRFAIAMAGNPYTESGAKFELPDMLANRADTYNLGDVLTGKEDLFALSYLENSLTANPLLAPLASRDPADFRLLVRRAQGEDVPLDQLSHPLSRLEQGEILAVLRKLLRVQQVLLAVNRQYILSAAQEDAYRTEPPFKLQGSYRNMSKLAEKIVPVMSDAELTALIDDHYTSEAQTLRGGAEHNLLKLAALRDCLTPEQRARWEAIQRSFVRVQAVGGVDEDPTVRLIGQLGLMSDHLHTIGRTLERASASSSADLGEVLTPHLRELQQSLQSLLAARDSASSSAPMPAAPVPAAPVPAAPVPAAPVPAPDDRVLRALLAQVKQLSTHLQAIFTRLSELPQQLPVPAAPPVLPSGVPSAEALGPHLDKLAQSLEVLAAAPKSVAVVQTLSSGVYDLLSEMTTEVSETLLPLVQRIGRRLRSSDDVPNRDISDLLDRTLKGLDQLKDLLVALRKIDTRTLREPG